MPMLMRHQRLNKARAFLARALVPFLQPAGLMQNAPHTGRADGDDVGVDHHVSQPPVSFFRMEGLKLQDLFFFPVLYPKVAGNPAVVQVDFAVPFPPVVEFPDRQLKPFQEPFDRLPCLARPAPYEIDYLVSLVRLNPGAVQSSPEAFFKATCSTINSARTSSFCRILLSSFAIFS